MEIIIDYLVRNGIFKVKILPCTFNLLFKLFKDSKINKLTEIHICIFNEENEDMDFIINNDNVIDIIGEVDSLRVIDKYLKDFDINSYTINKLLFQIEDEALVLYDDDSLLMVEIKNNNKKSDKVKLIIDDVLMEIDNDNILD